MNKNITIGIIVDDLRQIYMAKFLQKEGYKVILIHSDELNFPKQDYHIIEDMHDLIYKSNIIVAPVPFIKVNKIMNITDFLYNLGIQKSNDNTFILYAGLMDNQIADQLNKQNIKYIDYYESENLTIYNTIATAEGIIAEAILNSNTNIHNSEALVLGYGKCAKTLACKLKGLGAKVTICARNNKDLSIAQCAGYNIVNLHNLIMEINRYEYIFNTIPAPILDENILSHINHESIILDIASMPGGVNKEYANNHNINVIHKLGIPGLYSPKSSGIALALDLLKIIN